MWECPAVQQLWAALRAGWAPLHSANQRGREEFVRSVFQLRLDAMPDKLWEQPEIKRLPEPTTADTSATHRALQAIWRSQVLATFHAIWRWSTAADAPEDLWTTAQAVAYHEGCLRAALANPRGHRARDSVTRRH
jgi:hypothetical protein